MQGHMQFTSLKKQENLNMCNKSKKDEYSALLYSQ